MTAFIGRREFITLLGGVAACPDVARAQQRGKVPRLGVLLFSNPQTDPQMEALRSGLRDLGYDDQSLSIFYRYAEGKPERLADLAAALLREKPDLVLALGGDVAPYAVKATSTIPIVFVSSADPVQLGLAASLSGCRPTAGTAPPIITQAARDCCLLPRRARPRIKPKFDKKSVPGV
jgi:putative ABC transport system substrate-binding protein